MGRRRFLLISLAGAIATPLATEAVPSGSGGGWRPSLGGYVTVTGPRGGEGANVAFARNLPLEIISRRFLTCGGVARLAAVGYGGADRSDLDETAVGAPLPS
jgi:hypothetical protein